jgi:hypothetical protein
MGIIRKFKSRLVDDVATIHKRWSVWLTLSGSAISIGYKMIPPNFDGLPLWAQNAIPAHIVPWVGIGLVLSSVVAQALKQKNLQGDNRE